MPIPVLLNAATFGVVGAISAAFTQLVTFLSGVITLKVGCAIAFVAATAALSIAMFTSFVNALGLIVEILPAEVIAFAAAIVPANLIICITAVFTARISRWVYDKNISTIKRICA